ncbi:unnamed protein product [Adineta steineri]|uniref:Uncharacterized protein n=1 Tax=Adineta steineri TaxID=433720 RepID=A0A818NUC5_9BILA|nr:unnamed protein product [Adineta steineri]CAF3612665.1 unnamed protein product [Adineta steineri]
MYHHARSAQKMSTAKPSASIRIIYKKNEKLSKYLQQALKVYKDNLPSYHTETAFVLNNLGEVYCQM